MKKKVLGKRKVKFPKMIPMTNGFGKTIYIPAHYTLKDLAALGVTKIRLVPNGKPRCCPKEFVLGLDGKIESKVSLIKPGEEE